MIPLVNYLDLPDNVTDFIIEAYDYSCHCSHTVLQVEDDGNLFAEWLKEQGYIFKYKSSDYPYWDEIAMLGT